MAFEGDGTGSSRTTAVHDLVKRCRTEGSFSGDAKADPGEAAAPTAGAAGKSTVFAASPTTARQTKDQRELLDCPLCYEVMYPPIQQVINGSRGLAWTVANKHVRDSDRMAKHRKRPGTEPLQLNHLSRLIF